MSTNKINIAERIAILKHENIDSRMVINMYLSNVSKRIEITQDIAWAALEGYDKEIPDHKQKTKDLAMKLYVACASIVNAKSLGLNETYLFRFQKMIDYMVDLSKVNAYVRNLVLDGSGWKQAFPLNGKWPLSKSRLAAAITIINNREYVVFEDDGNYLVPNLDYQIGNGVDYLKLIAAFKEADAAAKNNKSFMDNLKERTDSLDASEVIKNVNKDAKKATKEANKNKKKKERKRVEPVYVSKCGGGGGSDDGWETAAKVGLGCLAAVGLVYAGYKANEYFSSTEVVSSNKFGGGWGWK